MKVEVIDRSKISITKNSEKMARDINRIYNYNNTEIVVVNIHYPF